MENLNSGVFRVNVDGNLMQCNPALLEMFEYDSLDDINTNGLKGLYANPEDRERFVQEIYSKGEILVKDVLMKTKGGKSFWASISSRLSNSCFPLAKAIFTFAQPFSLI